MPKPHSGYDLIAAIQAAEDYLKLKTLTPCLLGLEFYERSLEKGHRHEAAAGRDCSARTVPAKGYWVEYHRPKAEGLCPQADLYRTGP